jgi:hypothetical protein
MEDKMNDGEGAKRENKDLNKKGWLSKYWGAIGGFIILSWPPFFGYMFLHGYLSGLGYGNTFVSLDVQETLWFFSAGISGVWGNLGGVISKIFYIALAAGIIMSLMLLFDFLFSEKIKSKYSDNINSIKDVNYYTWAKEGFIRAILFSAFSGGTVFFVSYAVPFLLILAFSVFFGFLVIGDLIGSKDAVSDLKNEPCIYAKPESNCTLVNVSGKEVAGFIAYSNEKATFLITTAGRIQLNNKGRVIQSKPFLLDIVEGLGKAEFFRKKWVENIDGRSAMLNDFISKNKENLNADKVFKLLGKSDIEFHYKEFPAYKLSTNSTCSVGFPFNWETKEIVNVVRFGECQ